ncbi:hypothetical protein NLX83_23035 [Allokutzneria sp. A3M-2-11 16]|uniref:hypothetical protein n=1 Tax=Allokutzneria sp. A3M-2-11 16 TaxID=2962043 RepID=UPI0020B8CA13|nr:hypothetical protein [Allokutzneria sp. A3M-2-11 16]MCP3802146.1 hypothetical protein [Allokutzneria sp. A3M-2-11 16]
MLSKIRVVGIALAVAATGFLVSGTANAAPAGPVAVAAAASSSLDYAYGPFNSYNEATSYGIAGVNAGYWNSFYVGQEHGKWWCYA